MMVINSLPDNVRTIVYFVNSYASWQKVAVENANSWIRIYMPSTFENLEGKKIK
ncbi:MAG: hypothetical protein WCR36_11300 [Bacteroidaceae bacterium]